MIFALYALPLGAILYPTLLCLLLGAGALVLDYRRTVRRCSILHGLTDAPAELPESLPAAETPEEEDYQRLLSAMAQAHRAQEADCERRLGDMTEACAAWVRGIKAPVSSMRTTLQGEDSPLSRKVLSDLLDIEECVGTAAAALRLDSDTADYVFREYRLNDVLRRSINRFSGEFIGRKISLRCAPTRATAVTDEKWLGFVLDQVLSNALEFTPECGCITIAEEGGRLTVSDTGAGIAPEDLPHIFEKGFSGKNGQGGQPADGLGLYLCRRICHGLGHGISAESQPGAGTKITIDLSQRRRGGE